MRRVMIVGQPGSGKSWLSVRLGACLGLPVHHMDHIHWQPGWVERSIADKVRLCAAVEAQDLWVFEGNFSTTAANRAARADLLVWLDLPVSLRLWRVTWRKMRGIGRQRPDMAPGCPERLGREAVAFYHYIWTTRHSGRARIAAVVAAAPVGLEVVRLRHARDAAAFLTRFQ